MVVAVTAVAMTRMKELQPTIDVQTYFFGGFQPVVKLGTYALTLSLSLALQSLLII